MQFEFRWNSKNRANVIKHELKPEDVEYVVNHPRRPFYPRQDGRFFRVQGPTRDGQWLDVLYTFDPMPTEADLDGPDEPEPEGDELARLLTMARAIEYGECAVYVFHAMPMPADAADRAQAKIKEAQQ
jgi:hypothetical protein